MEAVFDTDTKDNYLNTDIYSEPNDALLYSISTTTNGYGRRDVTKIRHVSGVRTVGAIYWEEKRFEVYERVIPWEVLKSYGGFFSNTRNWTWTKNTYKVKHKNYLWTAEMNGLAVAQFHLYHSHTFRKDKPATFAISREDEIFLLLVFLYSETKRQDAEQNG